MIHRAITRSMQTHNFGKEIKIVKEIARINGYRTTLIDKLLKKRQFKLAVKEAYPPHNNKRSTNF